MSGSGGRDNTRTRLLVFSLLFHGYLKALQSRLELFFMQ
jgi:hypothetical protein